MSTVTAMRGAVGFVGDLLHEVVAATEDLAIDADDLLGMVVVLAEDQGLRHLAAARKQFGGQAVAIGFEHRADLVRHHDGPVELLRGVSEILVELLVALGTGALVADRNLVALRDRAAVLADIGADAIDLIRDVDPVGHRALVGILRDEVTSENPIVCNDGVAVRPTMNASKYSST
jgi:hypothetical protein